MTARRPVWSTTPVVSTTNDGSGQSTATICVAPADVSITKTADHSAPVNAGDPIGFTVEVKNTGTGAATGVKLSDPLPAGSGSGVTWAVDPSVGTPAQFVLSGAKGSQTLGLASSTLPAGADYKVHITAQTSETECGTYDNTATLTTGNANNPDPVSAEESCALPRRPRDHQDRLAGDPGSRHGEHHLDDGGHEQRPGHRHQRHGLRSDAGRQHVRLGDARRRAPAPVARS